MSPIAESAWFKSSYSTNDGPECVEVALTPTTTHIRDSKLPRHHGPQLTVPASQWAAFVSYVGQSD